MNDRPILTLPATRIKPVDNVVNLPAKVQLTDREQLTRAKMWKRVYAAKSVVKLDEWRNLNWMVDELSRRVGAKEADKK